MSDLDDLMKFTIWRNNFRHFVGRKKRGRPSMDDTDRGLIEAIEKAMALYPEHERPEFQTLLKANAKMMFGDGKYTEGAREQFVERIMKKRRQK